MFFEEIKSNISKKKYKYIMFVLLRITIKIDQQDQNWKYFGKPTKLMEN